MLISEIFTISIALLSSVADGEMVAVEMERMLRLAEQCLERAKSFIERHEEPTIISSPTQTQALNQNQNPDLNQPTTQDTTVVVAASCGDCGEYTHFPPI